MAALLSILMTAGPASWITISVAAETVAGSWDVAQLMQERRGVSQARARFTEERRSDLFEEPLMLSGTLRYDAPARVEKRIDVPFEERYVVDGDALRLERRGKRPRKASLQDHPLLWTFV
ncbi:MAG: LolA-related protein, partial [Acidiferrobacterales bacterium]|nr:LolA-related protein [Acidiferrobacterales bacterium]